jgi:hypothetical protein
MIVHLVIYSNNEPFDTTKKITIESIKYYTSKKIIIHDYTLERIKTLYWFQYIENLPSIYKDGRRDGYFNSWKAFITKDVYEQMNEDDLLYYVDSSQYFINGFTQNIDKLCDIASKKGFIAGSCGNNVINAKIGCCDNIKIWNQIIHNNDNTIFLNKMHVLNSWFIIKKHEMNNSFINEWAFFSYYKNEDEGLYEPLVTYHHTADQSIFNILVYKYKPCVFYKKDIRHSENKNKNLVLEIINTTENIDDLFVCLQ